MACIKKNRRRFGLHIFTITPWSQNNNWVVYVNYDIWYRLQLVHIRILMVYRSYVLSISTSIVYFTQLSPPLLLHIFSIHLIGRPIVLSKPRNPGTNDPFLHFKHGSLCTVGIVYSVYICYITYQAPKDQV